MAKAGDMQFHFPKSEVIRLEKLMEAVAFPQRVTIKRQAINAAARVINRSMKRHFPKDTGLGVKSVATAVRRDKAANQDTIFGMVGLSIQELQRNIVIGDSIGSSGNFKVKTGRPSNLISLLIEGHQMPRGQEKYAGDATWINRVKSASFKPAQAAYIKKAEFATNKALAKIAKEFKK
tara:strand:+ start:3852 stop:4385 length:534 start_codon:yes stop_codon:yes gene_type:complete